MTIRWLAWLFVLTLIASTSFYLAWVWRGAANARALTSKNLMISPVTAVLCYFMPIIMFWRPFADLRDIWGASEAPENWFWFTVPGYFYLFWAAFVGDRLLQLRFYLAAEQGTLIGQGAAVVGFSILCPLIATTLQIRIVRQITRAQLRSVADSPKASGARTSGHDHAATP